MKSETQTEPVGVLTKGFSPPLAQTERNLRTHQCEKKLELVCYLLNRPCNPSFFNFFHRQVRENLSTLLERVPLN